MTTQSYILMPNPKWYIANLVGLPLGGGYLAAFSSLDQTSNKNIWMDASGSSSTIWARVPIPNTDLTGILFDENGSQGPFYFLFDSSVPSDLYYLEVYDTNGVLQWTIDNFNPGQSGGGGTVTTANNLQNQIINSLMWRCAIGTSTSTPGTFNLLAPGAHAGLVNNTANAAGLYTGPDIAFIKNNLTATDLISFPLFTPLGVNVLTGDVTPPNYFHFECDVAGSLENQKCVQFPVNSNVQNLSNQSVTITIWAKSSASSVLTLKWLQFFGDSAGSASNTPTITTLSLTPAWAKYTVTTTVPSAVGGTIGACGNSGLFLQMQYPLNATCSIDFILPRMYMGNLVPVLDFQTYDVIDSLINTPRTGDVKQGFATSFLPGYLLMNDTTIGSASSGATRANIDTFPLFNLLWNNVSNTYAPVSGGRGVSAVADFAANKTLGLTKMLSRFLVSAGAGSGLTTYALGQTGGAETVALAAGNLPPHSHGTGQGNNFKTSSGTSRFASASGVQQLGETATTDNGPGSSTPFGIIPPYSAMNFFIKL